MDSGGFAAHSGGLLALKLITDEMNFEETFRFPAAKPRLTLPSVKSG